MSDLLIETMVRGLKAQLIVHQSVTDKGRERTTYEARLGWARRF